MKTSPSGKRNLKISEEKGNQKFANIKCKQVNHFHNHRRNFLHCFDNEFYVHGNRDKNFLK